ncbi:HAD family hydrolase [Xylocopilactobacillus apis]|uniref:Phosphatase n=1 Tax=Xylocopilactobacillus apis TaxID=2932183 RepID=A0AAU9D525_9LACO|nr:HAD family hydrolase [Xylocopilactobacillus apis]BDR57380.1 phosphatase [Xylocopilactobacillus apis]
MLKAIFFDLDGTIIDTEKVITETLQQVLKEVLNLTVKTEDLTFVLGIPGERALDKFTKDPKIKAKIADNWTKKTIKRQNEYQIFPGILKMLNELIPLKIRTGIVTSQTKHEFEHEFTPFGLNDHFELVVTASDTTKHKPDPAPIKFALSKLDISPDQFLYVGDTAYDLKSAHQAGAKFALAGWGAHEQLQESDYLLTKPQDLLEIK